MIETITPAGCGGRRRQWSAMVLFAVGAIVTAAAIGGGLGLLGRALGTWTALAVGVAVGLLAALCAVGALRGLPQSRWQVPERWRRSWPAEVWAPAYGGLLGAGVATFQPIGAGWVAWGMAVAGGTPRVGALCGAAFALGRLGMVLPALGPSPARAAAAVAAGSRLATRRLGLMIGTIAVALVPVSVLSAAETGFDAVVTGPTTAFTQVGASGTRVVVRIAGAGTFTIPGASSPSLDGSLLAVRTQGGIDVIDWTTQALLTRLTGTLTGPALSWPLLAYRVDRGRGPELRVRDLRRDGDVLVVRGGRGRELGRPSLRGRIVAWHVSGGGGSAIRVARIGSRSGPRTILRSRVRALRDPTIGQGRVVWVSDTARCSEVWTSPVGGGAQRRIRSRPASTGRFWNLSLTRGEIVATVWTPGRAAQITRFSARPTRDAPCVPDHRSPLTVGPPPLPRIDAP